jgi:hypothetical protein
VKMTKNKIKIKKEYENATLREMFLFQKILVDFVHMLKTKV